jgi:hypothetical protein
MSLRLTDGVYVEKINGKPCLVRHRKQRRRPLNPDQEHQEHDTRSAFATGLDLLGEAFNGSFFKMDKEKSETTQDTQETESTNYFTQPQGNEHVLHPQQPSFLPPGMGQPPAGIYQYGNKQLALLPKIPGGPVPMMQQGGFGGFPQSFMYGSPPQMAPQMAPQMMPMMNNMGFGGFNSQYDKPAAAPAPVEVTTVTPTTSITITRHICANCGALRSRKYQALHPLQPGEVPPISYCRKCEKEINSTASESDIVVELSKNQMRRNRRHRDIEVDKMGLSNLHVCAQCGNPRSRKYQARHPLRQGETPPVTYCGKCQKDVTSSEDSNASESDDDTPVGYDKGGYEKRRERHLIRRHSVSGKMKISLSPLRPQRKTLKLSPRNTFQSKPSRFHMPNSKTSMEKIGLPQR